MSKRSMYVGGVIIGVALLAVGVFLNGQVQIGLFTGVGSGLLGASAASLLMLRMGEKDPNFHRQKEIEIKDERNQMIRAKAGERANKVMFFLLCGLALVLNLVEVDKIVFVVLGALMIIQVMTMICSYNYYEKHL